MSKKTNPNSPDVKVLQKRIDEGILLAQRRLLDRGLHDGLSFVIFREGAVCEVAAKEIKW